MKRSFPTDTSCAREVAPISWDDQFRSVTTLDQARSIVKGLGANHAFYSLYTTVDRVCASLKNRQIWLTRMDSDLFDDTIEHRKYGDPVEQKKLFVKCFSFGRHENAAMWGLYCPPTYQAIRIVIPGKAMSSWKEAKANASRIGKNKKPHGQCNIMVPYVSDIVYASVRRDESEPTKSNYLFWNGIYTDKRIKDIEVAKERKRVTGFVKDDEWKFENEARLFVKTPYTVESEHIALSIPEAILYNIAFTLSPWLTDEEEMFVRGRLASSLTALGRNVSADNNDVFWKSSLRDGLTRWKSQRGL